MKLNSKSQARTKADSEQKDEDLLACRQAGSSARIAPKPM